MISLSDGLPPKIANSVPPEWRANEARYWLCRDDLLPRYAGQWVAFAGGEVVASGLSAVKVLHAAAARDDYPYFARVGAETEPCRMRRVAFLYDSAYPGEPLPQLIAEFRAIQGVAGVTFDEVIPDTGADATALPWPDCVLLGLDPTRGLPGRVGGVGASSAATLVFAAWVLLDGVEYPCQLQTDFSGGERILGRDVLNRVDVLFRGPAGEVVVNP